MKILLIRTLREPLVHFLVLGAGLFVLFGAVNQRNANEPGRIVVAQSQIQHLATGFSRTWRRPPDAQEIEGLIRDYIREEVYYREAVGMGLDRDDSIVRRRLQQKLQFVSEDVALLAEPTEDDLRAFLESHPEKFRAAGHVSFIQVYLDPHRHRDGLARDAAALLARLRRVQSPNDVATVGDAFLLAGRFDKVPTTEVATLFGEKFAETLTRLPPGEWQGPVESGYGVHLVFVSERKQSALPALNEVRDNVRREWANLQRQKANEEFYQKLLSRYTVTIEAPPHVANAAVERVARQ
jgi:hypothetical protein